MPRNRGFGLLTVMLGIVVLGGTVIGMKDHPLDETRVGHSTQTKTLDALGDLSEVDLLLLQQALVAEMAKRYAGVLLPRDVPPGPAQFHRASPGFNVKKIPGE